MKVKLTKGELKTQRDALKQYLRYLPTLQLKKQQIQLEMLRQHAFFEEKRLQEKHRTAAIELWAGLLTEAGGEFPLWLKAAKVHATVKNIAGIDVPVFERAEFDEAEYDLFQTPAWYDGALDALRALVALRSELRVIAEGLEILRHELRITTQRVNLFEKVKVPQAQEAIRRIKIYIGDQMSNAVGRSKIAKKKIEGALDGALELAAI